MKTRNDKRTKFYEFFVNQKFTEENQLGFVLLSERGFESPNEYRFLLRKLKFH